MSTIYHDSRQLTPPCFSRICTTCGIEKPFEQFHRHKKSPNGYRPECKECRHAEYKQNYKPRSKPLPLAINGGKVCRKCLDEKPLELFGKDKRASDGRGSQCKACIHYRQQVVNHEQSLARTRRNYERNGDSYKETHKKWYQVNHLHVSELSRRRVAREKAARIGRVSYKRILKRDDAFCYICEQPILVGQKIDFDHVIPLDRNGAHTEDNIKVTHATCNRRKGTKLISEMTLHQRRGII